MIAILVECLPLAYFDSTLVVPDLFDLAIVVEGRVLTFKPTADPVALSLELLIRVELFALTMLPVPLVEAEGVLTVVVDLETETV